MQFLKMLESLLRGVVFFEHRLHELFQASAPSFRGRELLKPSSRSLLLKPPFAEQNFRGFFFEWRVLRAALTRLLWLWDAKTPHCKRRNFGDSVQFGSAHSLLWTERSRCSTDAEKNFRKLVVFPLTTKITVQLRFCAVCLDRAPLLLPLRLRGGLKERMRLKHSIEGVCSDSTVVDSILQTPVQTALNQLRLSPG